MCDEEYEEQLQEVAEKISQFTDDSTGTFSTQFRRIATGLIVLVWGFLYNDNLTLNWNVIGLLVSLLLSFAVDLAQYYYIAISYSRLRIELKAKYEIMSKDTLCDEAYDSIERINHRAYRLFCFKGILLIPITLFLIITCFDLFSTHSEKIDEHKPEKLQEIIHQEKMSKS